jgi:hypothetical protein
MIQDPQRPVFYMLNMSRQLISVRACFFSVFFVFLMLLILLCSNEDDLYGLNAVYHSLKLAK